MGDKNPMNSSFVGVKRGNNIDNYEVHQVVWSLLMRCTNLSISFCHPQKPYPQFGYCNVSDTSKRGMRQVRKAFLQVRAESTKVWREDTELNFKYLLVVRLPLSLRTVSSEPFPGVQLPLTCKNKSWSVTSSQQPCAQGTCLEWSCLGEKVFLS